MALIKKDDQVTLEKYSVEKVFIDKTTGNGQTI